MSMDGESYDIERELRDEIERLRTALENARRDMLAFVPRSRRREAEAAIGRIEAALRESV